MTQYGAVMAYPKEDDRDAALQRLREDYAADLARASKVSDPIDTISPMGVYRVALKWWIA